jgi:hypothetical protein
VLIGIGSCGAEEIRNPQLDRWCGDKPCDWQVQGDVKRIGTWHPNDYAVELVSADAALIQENSKINSYVSNCLSFTMVAKVPEGVKAFLELDFLADGSVDFSQRLPVSDWERRTFKVTTPDWYNKMRFIIRKEGDGRAAFAEISAHNANQECTAPPVELLNRPLGAACSSDDQCADPGLCVAGHCGACASDASCEDNEVCALRATEGMSFKQCVGRAEVPLGAACDRNEQCQSAVCANGACSECEMAADCDAGRACQSAVGRVANSSFWPNLCGPERYLRNAGEVCTSNQDCMSSMCQNFQVSCVLKTDCPLADPTCYRCAPEITFGECR